jgi:hypothetical protein
MKTPSTAIDRLEELLNYRLPQSGKALTSIVLSRPHAEELLKEIRTLRLKLSQATE